MHRLAARSAARRYGVYLNPRKPDKLHLVRGDSIIVLAQDEH